MVFFLSSLLISISFEELLLVLFPILHKHIILSVFISKFIKSHSGIHKISSVKSRSDFLSLKLKSDSLYVKIEQISL